MVKTYKGLLSLICCLLLATVFSLPLAAQSTAPQSTPQSDVNQDRNLSTPSTPSDQYNSAHPSAAPETQPTDLDREKPADSSDKPQDRSTDPARSDSSSRDDSSRTDSDSGRLPGTASGIPLVGLIGAASLFGAAIRRRYF